MNESGTLASLIAGILAGMLMAFGLVLVVEFLAKPDSQCQASLYVQVRNFAQNI